MKLSQFFIILGVIILAVTFGKHIIGLGFVLLVAGLVLAFKDK